MDRIFVALGIVVALCLMTNAQAFAQSGTPPHEFRVEGIGPLILELTPEPGKRERYQVMQARVMAWPSATEEEMKKFADDLQNTKLRGMADSSNANMVWVTFQIEETTLPDGRRGWKTYRLGYQKDANGWRSLEKKK